MKNRILKALPAKQPIHAVVELTRSRHSKGHFLNDDFEGSALIDITLDESAMRVTYDRALLDRGETNNATGQALIEIVPPSIENAVNFATPLLRLLVRGRAIEEKTVAYEGRTTRLLSARRSRSLRPASATPTICCSTATASSSRR